MIEDSAETLALQALGWIAADEDRLVAFLRLSGLSIDELQAKAGQRSTLIGVLEFLLSRESDLLACMEELGEQPTAPARAHRTLTGQQQEYYS